MFSIIGSTGVIVAFLLVAVSSEKLSGNQNLWLHDNKNNLRSTSVDISIDQDVINEGGIYAELNCISPRASPFSFQQFIFTIDPSQPTFLFGQVAAWSGAQIALQINADALIASNLSTTATIPANRNLHIQLNSDDNDIITSVDFSFTQSNASPSLLGQANIDLKSQNLTSGSRSVSSLSPVFACTFNIVGFGNDTDASFSSGSGTITYSSQNSLKTSASTPPGSLVPKILAPESSNVEYGGKIVQKSHRSLYTQTFKVPSA
jgi:hypothetical protein